jgi:CheY-like chemotaxis protein
LAEEQKPDIILLDLIMPVMNGLQALKAIRESGDYGEHVPIIIFTNLDINNKISDEVSRHKPSFYIIKADMKIDEVVRKVRELLEIE